MRKIYALGFFLFFVTVQAQTIFFPDANFKTRLMFSSPSASIAFNSSGARIKIDSNNDGEIQQTEASAVWTLVLTNANISDLTGLEFFTNLRNLDVLQNPIVSFNFPQLSNLTNFSISGTILQNISNPSFVFPLNLTRLVLDSFNFIQEPSIPNSSNLQRLTILNSNFSTFNTSNYPLVNRLILRGNGINQFNSQPSSNLTELELDEPLSNLNLNNLSGILKLTISNASNLFSLNLSSLVSLSELKIFDCASLNSLNVVVPNPTTISIRNCSQLTNLDLPGTSNSLFELSLENTGVTSVITSGYSQLSRLYLISCPLNTPLNLTSNPNIATLYFRNINPSVFLPSLTNLLSFPNLLELSIIDCPINGPIFYDFTGLQTINLIQFNNCGITNADLRCYQNASTFVTLNNNPSLTTFDTSNFQGITNLFLANTGISTLTFGTNPFLSYLNVNNTQLTHLDLSNTTITQLFANNNSNLNSINIKNGRSSSSFNLNFSNCPNLQSICGDDNEINAIQTRINEYGYTNCFTSPYCSFNIGGTAYQLNGNILLDLNNNGCSPTDVPAGNVRVDVTRSGVTETGFTNSTGGYALAVNAGSYTITPVLEHPTYFTMSPATASVNFPTNPSPTTRDFCLTASGVRPDLEVAFFPLNAAVPGFVARYLLVYKNKGNTIQSGSVSLNFPNTLATLTNATPAAATQSGGNLTWNFSNLQPFESRSVQLQFTLNTPMATPPLNSGDMLPFTATVTGAIDQTPADNTFTLNPPVVNSYDPNDKTCLQGTVVGTSVIGQYVHYLIRFENTGTFPATNVIITDVIDTNKFDINTLIPLQASHAFRTRVVQNNRVEFVFQGINLPFDDANNDGYVAFKIKTKNTLVVGDTFDNTANIFFDYNYPIITNTASTLIQNLGLTTSAQASFALAQNPVGAQLTFTALSAPLQSVSIYNSNGQLVQTVTHPSATGINVQALAPGVYFVKGISAEGTSVVKMVKE